MSGELERFTPRALNRQPSKAVARPARQRIARITTTPNAPERAHRIKVEPGDGFVIKFALRFSTGPTVYNYAALKVRGRWYTTGQTCPPGGYSWRQLCEFIDSEDLYGKPAIWDGRA